jgi:hypothetical protein
LPPCEQGSRKIQLPYINKFETVWEYKEAFLSERIDFFSIIGPTCPLCGDTGCYRQITPYFRYAIDLFPQLKKEKIPIARFLCRSQKRTFSLLPIQLIPYFQYTVHAVLATLLLGLICWQTGRRGFYGACLAVDPDSLVTPWLVMYWHGVIIRAFRRAHAILGRILNFNEVLSTPIGRHWHEVKSYFLVLGIKPQTPWWPHFQALLHQYSRSTGQFLFGKPSQQRTATG